jgi:predicted PhzF superfamily epimerase YddE/YHI9
VWWVPLELTVVDAFTDRLFSGNPAAVCIVEEFPEQDLMQAIAAEMNLAETAFAVHRSKDEYDLRWFTPTVEVGLCGHATLAATHVIGRSARFQTKSGELACSIADDGLIEMDFPADAPNEAPLPEGTGLHGVEWFGNGRFDGFAVLESAAAVRSLVPDLAAIERLFGRGLIVTAAGDRPGIDCVSRFFAPAVGIPEDPVTGSAHCTLSSFWGARLARDELTGVQASARGGIVRMRRSGERVVLGGRAVTASRVAMLI